MSSSLIVSDVPTPLLSHLRSPQYSNVYEPAEDSFLLMDALEQEKDFLNQLRPLISLEIGSGSGAVLTFLTKLLHLPSFLWAVDLSFIACKCTVETLSSNGVVCFSDTVAMDLVSSFRRRLSGKVDVLIFNPPYVVTPSEEVGREGLEASWAGGEQGREVINRFMPFVSDLLSPGGVFYLVVIKENDPADICSKLATYGLNSKTIMSRRARNEFLSVIKFCKQP